MSIDQMLRIAVTGLNTHQQVLRNISNNIVNVNTEGYNRKVTTLKQQIAGGQGIGVTVSEVRRITDTFLARQVQVSSSETGRLEVKAEFHDRLQAMFGSPNQNITLSARLEKLYEGFAALPIEPDNMVRRTGAVNAMQDMANEIKRLAADIQLLRGEAEKQIGEAVLNINTLLTRIRDLNESIAREDAIAGSDSAALKEDRDLALEKLSQYMDVRTFKFNASSEQIRPSTEFLGVSGANGVVLVDSLLRQLSYTSPGSVDTATTFDQIVVGKVTADGTVDTEPNQGIIDKNIVSGELKGLLEMRDEVLPKLALELGEFSSKLVDNLNKIHNQNTTVPAPSSLTGRNTGLISTDATGFTGKVTIATFNSSNNFVNRVEIDFDAGTINTNGGGAVATTLTTLGDVVTAVNGALGANTMQLVAGKVSLNAPTGAAGVGVLQDATTPSARAGRGFSHFFGLNDVMEATGEAHYDTGLTTSSSHNFGAGGTTTIELRDNENTVVKTFDLTVTNINARGTTMQDVLDELNASANLGNFGTWALDSNGRLSFTASSSFPNVKPVITDDTMNRGSTGLGFGTTFGIGDRHLMNAAKGVTVLSAIVTDPSKLALARIDTSSAATAGTVPALTAGDGAGAVAFQQLSELVISYRAAGNLAAVSGTLDHYAANIIADISSQAAFNEVSAEDQRALLNELTQRLDNIGGVNMDEELSQLVIFENAYNASARLIAIAQELFDTLIAVASR
jgi:flagellar hook-associated protein 1 FlgK